MRGKTTLKGGAITSTQAAVEDGRNGFDSQGGVELQDLQNTASYEAGSTGVTVGAGDQLSSSGAGVGADEGNAQSTTQAAISGVAGNKDARTGDAESGLKPIFDQERVRDEVEAQVAITKVFGQQAVPAAARYADDQAIALRKEGREEEARKWDEGGEYRMGPHAVIGALTGGGGFGGCCVFVESDGAQLRASQSLRQRARSRESGKRSADQAVRARVHGRGLPPD